MKRIYITLGVLLIGMMGMAYLYFSNLNIETSANDLSLNAAASHAGIVFSFDNEKSFYEILSGQDLLQNILGSEKSKQFKSLRDNLISNQEISNALENQKIYIGILPGAGNEVDFLVSTQLKSSANVRSILDNFERKHIELTKIGTNYKLTFADSTSCFLLIKDRLVVVSNAISPLQNLLKAQKPDQNFIDYVKENSRGNKNTLANLYINFSQLPFLLKNILNSNLVGELSIFNKQTSYASLSYNFSKENLLFNGSTAINDLDSYEQLFVNIPASNLTIENILPKTTANYIIYNVENYKNWQQTLNTWFEKGKESIKIDQQITNLNKTYMIDLKQTLPNYFKNQFITFELNTGEKFGAVALNNGEKVNQFLLDLSSDYAPDVKIFKETGIAYSFFGTPFKKFERPFYTIIDNYLIMANNASSVQSFLAKYKSNELLVNDEEYIAFRDQISSSATILYYVSNKNSNAIFGRNLKLPYYRQYQSTNGFKDYTSFSYQLSGDNGKFLSNLLLYKKQKFVAVDSLATAN